MNVDNATEALIALFDVTEKRYPALLASIHVNQACIALSEENDLWFDRFVFDSPYSVPLNPSTDPQVLGGVSISGILYQNLGVGFIRNIFWLKDSGIWTPIDGWEYREALLTHSDELGEPQNAVIIGDSVLIRPVPEYDSTARFEVKGKPVVIGGTETNGWLTHHPFAVLYKSAIYAATYMMEDKRLATFTSMFTEEAERAALHGSMMVMSEPRVAQEPG